MTAVADQRDAIIRRARELDDDQPDDRCPGCRWMIADWEHYDAHLINGPWVMAKYPGNGTVCPWTRDMLVARSMRRRLIATGDMNPAKEMT